MKVTTTVFLHSFLVLLLNSTREGTSIIQIHSAYSAIRICMYHFLPSWFKMGRTTFLFTAADFPLCKIDPKKKMFSHLLKKSLRLWIKHLWQEYNPRFAAVKSRLGLSFSSLTFAFPFFCTEVFCHSYVFESHLEASPDRKSGLVYIRWQRRKAACSNNPRVSV